MSKLKFYHCHYNDEGTLYYKDSMDASKKKSIGIPSWVVQGAIQIIECRQTKAKEKFRKLRKKVINRIFQAKETEHTINALKEQIIQNNDES